MRKLFNATVAVAVIVLLCLAATPAGAQGILYSISSDFFFDASNNPVTFLRTIDPTTGATISSMPISMANPPPPLPPPNGFPKNTFVLSGNGLAAHPQTGQLFALLTVESEADANQAKRHLATLDPNTGVATLIGDTGKFSGLAFTTGGPLGAGVLLAVTGDGASGAFCPPDPLCLPATLYQLSVTDAHATLLKNFGTPGDGEAIAFNPADLRVYHASGFRSSRIFESIDPAAFGGPTTPIPLTGFQEPGSGSEDQITALAFSQGVFFAADTANNPPGNLLSITPGGVVTKLGTLDHKSKGLVFVPPPTTLVAAVLPNVRAVLSGTVVTVNATVINAGSAPALQVGIGLATPVPTTFSYRRFDTSVIPPVLVGLPNTPVDIPVGGHADFVLFMTPSAPFGPTELVFTFQGSNTPPVGTLVGINTLLLLSSATPTADMVALAATSPNDGIVRIPGVTGTGVFAVATTNLGVGDTITVSADTGAAVVPVDVQICETNPGTGACLAPPTPTVTTFVAAGAQPTFGFFVRGLGVAIPLDPAVNRVFARFRRSDTVIVGGTSVAVITQ